MTIVVILLVLLRVLLDTCGPSAFLMQLSLQWMSYAAVEELPVSLQCKQEKNASRETGLLWETGRVTCMPQRAKLQVVNMVADLSTYHAADDCVTMSGV